MQPNSCLLSPMRTQWWALGPILFSIFISCVDNDTKSLLVKFAGDTNIGGVINNKEARLPLQNNLNHLFKWSQSNKMCFNTAKWKIIHLGTRNAGYTYRMGIGSETAWGWPLRKARPITSLLMGRLRSVLMAVLKYIPMEKISDSGELFTGITQIQLLELQWNNLTLR